MSATSIALNRFGLGARPDQPPPGDPRNWLTAQIDRFDPRPAAIAAVPGRKQVVTQLSDYFEQNRDLLRAARGGGPAPAKSAMSPGQPMSPVQPTPTSQPMPAGAAMPGGAMQMQMAPGADAGLDEDAKKKLRQFLNGVSRDNYIGQIGARASVALGTDTPFIERMVWFWANHFAVSADKITTVGISGLLEFEAIRPHVCGRFSDMLNAVERHPAMLLYLDQAESIGPDSPFGARAAARGKRKVGLNENLAREIMELHTLGVRTGYSQADVTEFARALTGWTTSGLNRGPLARFGDMNGAPGDFQFVEVVHEPGTRTIMGRRYGQQGERQAQAVLDDLAAHPATATHIATKLARHFVGDNPSLALVARLQASFQHSGGDLPALYRTLIASPEVWRDTPGKFRSPWEWSIASMRALNQKDPPAPMVAGLMTQLGQPVWKPGSPAGFEDMDATWAGADAVMRRVEAAQRMASRAGATIDARALAPKLYPGALSAATDQAIARAESPAQALALLLVAPESMRR